MLLDLWQEVRKTTEAKCTEVLAPFALAAEGVMQAPATESISSQLGNASAPDVQPGARDVAEDITLCDLRNGGGAL